MFYVTSWHKNTQNNSACPKKEPLRIFLEDWMIFLKTDYKF
jgi:hypothetical protein